MTTATTTPSPHLPTGTDLPDEFEPGHYLCSHTAITTVTTTRRDPNQPPNATPEVEQVVLVSAADFMDVQRERDEYRKVVALINAWRITPGRSETRLKALLASAGQGDGEAEAMLSLIRWAEAERHEPGSGG